MTSMFTRLDRYCYASTPSRWSQLRVAQTGELENGSDFDWMPVRWVVYARAVYADLAPECHNIIHIFKDETENLLQSECLSVFCRDLCVPRLHWTWVVPMKPHLFYSHIFFTEVPRRRWQGHHFTQRPQYVIFFYLDICRSSFIP